MRGPIAIGNGRFLGLGVLAPYSSSESNRAHPRVLGLQITSKLAVVDPLELTSALRRAVLARYQAECGSQDPLPSMICGHERDGQPTTSPHVAFGFDRDRGRLFLVLPPGASRREAAILQRALDGFVELRAGAAGRLTLQQASFVEATDPIVGLSCSWFSVTPYVVNRHRRLGSAEDALTADILDSCHAAGLPKPAVTLSRVRSIPDCGLTGHAELRFDAAVPGPILLGRTRYAGGGLFQHGAGDETPA